MKPKDMDTDDLLDDLRALMKKDKGEAGDLFRELDKRMSDPDGEAPEDWGGGGEDDDDGDEDE